MTIVFPITLHASPAARRTEITELNAVGVSESPFTMDEQAYGWPGAAWAIVIEWPPMPRITAAPILADLSSLRGRYGTFLFGDYDRRLPQGSGAGAPKVDGSGQTGRVLRSIGWTPFSAVLKADDLIQLGSGATTRLHKVVADAVSDSAGRANLDIWPALRTSPTNLDPIVTTNPKGRWRLQQNLSYASDERPLYVVKISAKEAIS